MVPRHPQGDLAEARPHIGVSPARNQFLAIAGEIADSHKGAAEQARGADDAATAQPGKENEDCVHFLA